VKRPLGSQNVLGPCLGHEDLGQMEKDDDEGPISSSPSEWTQP
jgi:hypothetical protein